MQDKFGAVQKSPLPTMSCRAIARHPSLRSGRRPQGEPPRLMPRGDSRRDCTKTFLVQPQINFYRFWWRWRMG